MRMNNETRKLILEKLEKEYKGSKTALNYKTAFELLIAVILSAQCTDERVNIITARMFPQFNTPQALSILSQAEMENLIRDCGLYKAKAKNILATCNILCNEYNGEVPQNFEDLIKLPGVGRKTANVVLSQLFDIPAIAVDTHVFRVSNRTKLAQGKTPIEVEEKLMKAIPKKLWAAAHHWLIWHGRLVCKARKPLCSTCILNEICPSKS